MLSPIANSPRFTNEETMIFVKKNINTTERNATLLKHALESYNKHQVQLQGKGMKIATVLEILAEQAESNNADSLTRIAKIVAEKETARVQLTQRVQSLSIEIMAAYPAICDKLMSEMKGQKSAILTQKKKREMAENIMLKESGELGNLKSRRISKSQLDLADAVSQVSLKTEHLQDSLNRFEERKAQDLKMCLQEFIWSEMAFHAKALELLTEAQNEVDLLLDE